MDFYIIDLLGTYPVTVINTKDSERLKISGDCLLVVKLQDLSLYKLDLHMHAGKFPIAKWDLDDIPRFRLQKLNQLNDAEKIFIINLARYIQVELFKRFPKVN